MVVNYTRWGVQLLPDRQQATLLRKALLQLIEKDELLSEDLDAAVALVAELSNKMHQENKRVTD